MTYLDTLFTPPGPSLVLTPEQIAEAASSIGLTPTKEQLDDLCDGHISAIMFHAAAKAGRFGAGVVLDDAAEDWRSELGGGCGECEGVPEYSLGSLEPHWDATVEVIHWDQMRWEIENYLTSWDRAETEEEYGALPEVADVSWVRQFVESLLSSNNRIGESCSLAIITLGAVDAYGVFNVSGFSFTDLSTNFYGASYDREVATAWRIRHIGIQHESEVAEETLQLLDFAALRRDVLEHWAKQEAADAAGGNS
jgi:hypothetical protein